MCQGTAGGVMGMATSQQDELWAAVEAGDGARVAAVSAALRLAPRARGDRQPTLPLRVYVRTGDVGAPAWPWPAFASVTSTRPPCLAWCFPWRCQDSHRRQPYLNHCCI